MFGFKRFQEVTYRVSNLDGAANPETGTPTALGH